MTKRNMKILISISIILIIALIQFQSFAATNSLTITLDADKTQIKEGETVTILIKASNIQGEGIIGFNANVNYNSDIFECVASGDDYGIWTRQGFIENNLTTTRSDLEASTEDQTIAKLTFKAKSDVTIGIQEISLSQIEFATESESYNVNDVATNVEIIQETTSGEENNNTIENTTTGNSTTGNSTTGNSTTGNVTNQNKVNSVVGNENTASGITLPKTGFGNYLLIIAIITIIVAVGSFYQYKKYKNV